MQRVPGALPNQVSRRQGPQLVVELPPARSTGVLIDGAPGEAAGKLAALLRDEAKVI